MKPVNLIDLFKCRIDPWYFLTRFVRTLEREKGEASFPEYIYLKDLINVFQRDTRVVILKSRQMMVTWSAAAFALWEAIFRGNADILFLSKREDDAKEAIRRLKYIYDRLPGYMRPRTGENTKYVLEFPIRNSRLMALPTHPNIGRTFSPTRIIWDEMASTPFDEEIFASLQPSLDGGGFFIGISTSQGPNTKHAELYLNAEAYGFTPVAIHYSLNPEKDEKWCLRARRGMSDQRWKMEQEMSMEMGGNRIYPAFQNQKHILPDFFQDPEAKIYRTIDFGYHTPVVLWALVQNGEVILFNEWIGEDSTVSDMVNAIVEIDELLGCDEDSFTRTFCDPAGAAKTDFGISSLDRMKAEYWRKTGKDMKISYRQSSVMAGIDLVREKLCNAAGEIKLKVTGKCSRTAADFARYVKKNNSEEPKKDGIAEHTMDAVRYLVVNLFQSKRACGTGRPKPRVEAVLR